MKNLIKCYCGHTTTCDCIDMLELVQIPEEPKQETLEEVGMYQQELFSYLHDLGVTALQSEMQEIERIVLNMQQEQDKKLYSEEEVIELLKTFDEKFNSGIVERNKGINNWFEQFKKK